MKNKTFALPSKMPKNLDWLFYSPIFLSQVINETINTRIILFLQHKNLDLCFHKEKQKRLEEKTFIPLEELYYFFCVFEKNEKTFFFSLSSFQGEGSHKKKKPFHFYFISFSSGSFQIILKLSNIIPSISHLLGWVRTTYLGTQTQFQSLFKMMLMLFCFFFF